MKSIQIDPDEGRVILEVLDGVIIQGGETMIRLSPENVGYWDMTQPDTQWCPSTDVFKVHVDKKKYRVRFEGETEESVTIVVEPREVPDAPDTGKLPPISLG